MQKAGKSLSLGRVLRSVIVAVLVLILLLLIVAVLISEELLPLKMEKIYLGVSLVIASAVSSGILVRSTNERKMPAALINAGVLLLILMLYALTVGEGRVSGVQMLYLCSWIWVGSITACVLAILKPLRRRRR